MNQKILDKKIVVTGGGSGGHVSVALGFIEELERKYSNISNKLLYIGSDLGMQGEKNGESYEQRQMKSKNIKFVTIRAGKLQRALEFRTITLLLRTVLGMFDSYKYIHKFRPDIVFCTGGFLSVPVAFSAWLHKIPIYLHEQTAAVGLANKIISKFAKKIFVTFPSSMQYFPKSKTIHTGNVVRASIFEKESQTELANAVKKMKKENLPIVYISGGGQGSHKINCIVRQMLTYSLQNYQIVLQTGDNQVFKDYDVIEKDWQKLPTKLKNRLYITKFVNNDEIGFVFNNIDLFVGRSGANTVYELGVLQIPSLLIPIPWVTHNEQELNAKILESLGLSTILPEGEMSCERLNHGIQKRLEENKSINVDTKKAQEIFTTDAKQIITQEMDL